MEIERTENVKDRIFVFLAMSRNSYFRPVRAYVHMGFRLSPVLYPRLFRSSHPLPMALTITHSIRYRIFYRFPLLVLADGLLGHLAKLVVRRTCCPSNYSFQ